MMQRQLTNAYASDSLAMPKSRGTLFERVCRPLEDDASKAVHLQHGL
jgi:hypothetical protein